MKDKEMAEEYRKSLKQRLIDEDDFERLEMFDENVEEAFLTGLKAGRPQWHDLRKNPNDLPESRHKSIVNQDGEKVMYDYSCKAWRYDDADEYLCDTPIAWCEIPQFKE